MNKSRGRTFWHSVYRYVRLPFISKLVQKYSAREAFFFLKMSQLNAYKISDEQGDLSQFVLAKS